VELQHRFTVAAPIEQTWAAFNDLERVAPCFPGAELTSVDGDEFTGACKVKLGPISMQYTGRGTFIERDASAYRAVIEAKGKDKRGNGTAGATVTAQLRADGGRTQVDVATDLQITGKPAQFGRGVIQDVSDRLLDQFVACLQDKLAGERTDASAPAESEHQPEAVAPERAGPAAAVEPVAASPADREPESSLNLVAVLGPAVARRVGPPVAVILVVWLLVRRLRRS
jgi:carbon monoxide dehydrogenase subunit G